MNDTRSSTPAGRTSIVGGLIAWFDDRTGAVSFAQAARTAVPRVGWSRAWPSALAFAVFLQAITGFFLWLYYSPSSRSAWESVYYIQHEVAGGWLLRAMHHYTAHVLVAMVIVYVLQMVFTAANRPPREVVFWLGLGVGACVMAAILTGDLLYWDANGFSSTKVRVGFLVLLPWVGESLRTLAVGDSEFGSLSLTRFFALHVGVFGAAAIVLAALQWLLARRIDHREAAAQPATAEPVWPWQALRNVVACLAVLVVVLGLSLMHGVGPHAGVFHGSPADVSAGYDAARPEWMLVGVYEFSHLFSGALSIVPIFVVPTLIFLFLLATPFLARSGFGRAVNIGLMSLLIAGCLGMTVYSWWKDSRDPLFRQAVAAEQTRAERVRVLAQAEGIPAGGGLALLRNDPKTEGAAIFKAHCASCHNYTDPSGARSILVQEPTKPSAPELFGFASRKWLAGLLDPKQVDGPHYFGNTAMAKGDMPNFVKSTLGDLDDLEKEDLETLIAALSAEANLPAQRELDARDAEKIAAGRALLSDYGCTNCHRFRGAGSGTAPELTGYGSQEWTAGIIHDPAAAQFYGKRNDRMPAYHEIFSPEQIALAARFVRGDWYEPAAPPADVAEGAKPPAAAPPAAPKQAEAAQDK